MKKTSEHLFALQISKSLVVSGPLWIGCLHNAAFVTEMLHLATEWGWACTTQKDVNLEKLLNRMIEEGDPRLPPGYIKVDEVQQLTLFLSCLFD